MLCFLSLNVDIFGTRQNIKKQSTAFIHVFHALSYDKIKSFISYPLSIIFSIDMEFEFLWWTFKKRHYVQEILQVDFEKLFRFVSLLDY